MRTLLLISLALITTAILGLLPSRPDIGELNHSSALVNRYSADLLQNFSHSSAVPQASQSNTVERALARAISEVPAPQSFANSDTHLAPKLISGSDRPNRSSSAQRVSLQPLIANNPISTSERLRAVRSVLDTVTRGKRDSARLSRQIVTECEKAQFDPMFVAAVIKSESFFNELARSNKGAVGLMQIMPATGKYLEKFRSEVDWPTPAKLTDAGYNIHLGVTYLKQLEEMYGGNRVLTLIAYNWGPGKLDRAIRSGRGVPAETVRYALKILSDRHGWLQQRAAA